MTEDPRISEIRADHHRISGLTQDGVGSWCSCGLEECTALWLLDHIDSLTPPAPRVFFPGDTVPAGVVVIIPHVNDGYSCYFGPLNIGPTDGYAIELPIPTAAERQAAVDRARAERPEVQP